MTASLKVAAAPIEPLLDVLQLRESFAHPTTLLDWKWEPGYLFFALRAAYPSWQ